MKDKTLIAIKMPTKKDDLPGSTLEMSFDSDGDLILKIISKNTTWEYCTFELNEAKHLRDYIKEIVEHMKDE